ncbi:glycyl-tRNA synthetase [Pedobacter sp. BAL39]|nr:glycyl-tRNA synthetase [Pedobacter sp. BAL39]
MSKSKHFGHKSTAGNRIENLSSQKGMAGF